MEIAFRRTSLIFFASKTRNYLYRQYQINEGPFFKVQNSLQESRKTRVPSIVSKFQKRDGNFAKLAERAIRCESGSSQSSYIKFYASGVSVRPVARASDRHHRARRPRFCAASSPIVFYLAASMAALIVRKKIRKTTDVFCALPRYFIGDSRIASLPHLVRRVVRRSTFQYWRPPSSLPGRSRRSPSRRDNFFGRSSSRNSAARIFRPFSSYIPAR